MLKKKKKKNSLELFGRVRSLLIHLLANKIFYLSLLRLRGMYHEIACPWISVTTYIKLSKKQKQN